MTGEQEIGYLLDRYNEALLKGDVKSLDEIWADDLSFVNPQGMLLTKKDRIDNIKSGATELKTADVSEKKIHLYGHTAVATLVVKIDGQYSGKPDSATYRVTTMWAKPKGTWQMVATQMTPIAK
jgi:ketosteroid isomerase-like protein